LIHKYKNTSNQMLKKLNLANGKEKKISLKDFEIITVNKKKGALGIGSFATVKLAKHVKTDKLFALKIVSDYKLTKINR